MRLGHSVHQSLLVLSVSISFLIISPVTNAQYVWNSDSTFKAGAPNSGRLWGYAFGDYAYKTHSDSLNRGGANQYTGIPANRTTFQFRRIYLGYDYNITKKFSAELLLAAEDNYPAGNPPTSTSASGDELLNNKLSFYIKLANIRWKNIWKGTDLVVGQMATPAYPLLTERMWNYRSVERTISDIRRTPSFDMGASLQGVFDSSKNIGYNLMVANGSSAKPESDNFKWFYGDVYVYFFKKKIVVDAYADYERLNWTTTWHHSRQMLKGYIAYNSSATEQGTNPGTGYTIGVEAFVNNLKNNFFATRMDGSGVDTLSAAASGISFYVHGDIIKSKLRFFARFDAYNPNTKVDNNTYSKYVSNTGNYNDNSYSKGTTATNDETYKQEFITAGLDFMPAKNVHFMPNIWYNRYKTQLHDANTDHDLVYRITFYYIFGK